MRKEEIHEVIKLINSVKTEASKTDSDKTTPFPPELKAIEFEIPINVENIPPCIAVDGSYTFLFSLLGADTWIVLFRIALMEYKISRKNSKIHYLQNSPPKYFDHLTVISFHPDILKQQLSIYREIASGTVQYQERKASLFASSLLSYYEQRALEKITEERSNCIILKDGALLSYKALPRTSMYEPILKNCRENAIQFGGISKSTQMRFFKNIFTDDYFLTRFYNRRFPQPSYIPISENYFKTQTRYDVWGKVYLAKLHEAAPKWFRVDIGYDAENTQALFSALGAYSKYHLLPGYPIPLIEAHKLAKSVRDLKGLYEGELIDYLKQIGISPEEFITGEVDFEGREYGSFHDLLDQLSK
ncbi:MAG: hypothetical protein JW776_07220 [Candidatus Lokiarchaeota archaeon]|nr:hypothetical protein [Candidatus Lokiarchaeota archaeon]